MWRNLRPFVCVFAAGSLLVLPVLFSSRELLLVAGALVTFVVIVFPMMSIEALISKEKLKIRILGYVVVSLTFVVYIVLLVFTMN